MKRFISLSLAVIATAAFSACSNKSEIEKTAKGYLEALGNYHVSDARPYATEKTCNITLDFFDTLMAHTDPSVYANNIPATITIGEITMTSDTSASVAYHKSTPSAEQDGTLNVIKSNKKWLVEQIIEIPPTIRQLTSGDTTPHPRTFTKEQIRQMRKN